MTPEQVQKAVSALAHSCLAKMLKREAHTDREVCAKATDQNGGLQVVVFFDRHVPMTADPLHHGPAAGDSYQCCHNPTRADILAATYPKKPLTTEQIAEKLGRKPNSYFRRQITDLVELGWLRPVAKGYCRSVPPAKSGNST